MGVEIILFPDTSDVVDAPYPFPLERFASIKPSMTLENKCKVLFEELDLPIGLSATDRFIMTLSRVADVEVPLSIKNEKGRVLDIITDM